MKKRGPLSAAEQRQREEAARSPAHRRHQAETTPSVRQGSTGAPSRAAVGLFRQGQARPESRGGRGVWDTRATELPVGSVNGTVTFHMPKAYQSNQPDPAQVSSATRPPLALTLADRPRGHRAKRRAAVVAQREITLTNPETAIEALRHPKMREIVEHTVGVVRDHQKATIERAYKRGLIPVGTSPGMVSRAYKHAALRAMHKAGLIHYETRMDSAARREFTPLNRFMFYAHRRVFDHLNQPPLQGKWAAFRDEFGELYRQKKHGKLTGVERMRMKPHDFIKIDIGDDLDLAKAYDAAKKKRKGHAHLEPELQVRVPEPPGGVPKIGGAHLHVRDAAKFVEQHFNCPPIGGLAKRQEDGTFLVPVLPAMPEDTILEKDSGFYLGADPYGADPYVSFSANPRTQLRRAMRPRTRRQRLKLRINAQRGLRRALSGGITRQGRWQLGLSSSPNSEFLKQEAEAQELDRQEAVEHRLMGARLHGRSAAGDAVRRLGRGQKPSKVVQRLLGEHAAELAQIQRQKLRKKAGDETGKVRGAQILAGAAGGVGTGLAVAGSRPMKWANRHIDRMAHHAGNAAEARFRLANRRINAARAKTLSPVQSALAKPHLKTAATVASHQGKILNRAVRGVARLHGRAALIGAAFAGGDYLADRAARAAFGKEGRKKGYRHFNALGFIGGTAGAIGAHAMTHARFAQKLIRRTRLKGRAGLIAGGIGLTAGLEASGTRLEDRAKQAFLPRALRKGIIGNAIRYGLGRISGAAARTRPGMAAKTFAAKPPVARAIGEAKSEGWKGVLAPGRFAGRLAGAAIGHRKAIAGLGAVGLAADFTPQAAIGAQMLGIGGDKKPPQGGRSRPPVPRSRTVNEGSKPGFRMSAMGKPLSFGQRQQPVTLRKASPFSGAFKLLGSIGGKASKATGKAAVGATRAAIRRAPSKVKLGATFGAGLLAHRLTRDMDNSPGKRAAIGAGVAGGAAFLLSRGRARMGVLRSSRALFRTGLKQGQSKAAALSAARTARKTGLAGLRTSKKLVAGAAALGAGAGWQAGGPHRPRLSMVEQ